MAQIVAWLIIVSMLFMASCAKRPFWWDGAAYSISSEGSGTGSGSQGGR
jgi:hypothetical protein